MVDKVSARRFAAIFVWNLQEWSLRYQMNSRPGVIAFYLAVRRPLSIKPFQPQTTAINPGQESM